EEMPVDAESFAYFLTQAHFVKMSSTGRNWNSPLLPLGTQWAQSLSFCRGGQQQIFNGRGLKGTVVGKVKICLGLADEIGYSDPRTPSLIVDQEAVSIVA